MILLHNLSGLHAELEVILPASACSLLRRAHPNDGNAKAECSAHGADSQFAKKQMLSRSLHPNDKTVKSVGASTRRRQSVYQLAHACTCRARRTNFVFTPSHYNRNGGMGACLHDCPWPLTFCQRVDLLYHVGGARCALLVAVNKRSGFGRALPLPFKPCVYYTITRKKIRTLDIICYNRKIKIL